MPDRPAAPESSERLFWDFIRWLLDRDPEYAAKLIARREAAS